MYCTPYTATECKRDVTVKKNPLQETRSHIFISRARTAVALRIHVIIHLVHRVSYVTLRGYDTNGTYIGYVYNIIYIYTVCIYMR
jgi:hypothetical protein